MGWIRAYQRELSFFRLRNNRKLNSLYDAISAFESALADGPHVEVERNDALCELWEISVNAESIEPIARQVEVLVKRTLEQYRVVSATDLDSPKKAALCRDIANMICDQAKQRPVPPDVLDETCARAVRYIAVQEAWLYRDWQSGIGDLMIRELHQESRRFDVIGFRDFEDMLSSKERDKNVWLDRLEKVFDGLDIEGEKFDARVKQLNAVMKATANIVIALAALGGGKKIGSKRALLLAREILDDGR